MLRGNNVLTGTSTTGTGTLTLAAAPSGSGGSIDFDTFARGMGYGNGAAVPTSYTLIEYADSTLATMMQMEKGVGVLTLGASAGVANCTLTRSTVQSTSTGMNGASPVFGFGSPITIGTAANVLVFIGVGAEDIPAFEPYFENTAAASDNVGLVPLGMLGSVGTTNFANGREVFFPFILLRPLLVSTISTKIYAAYTGGTSSVYARLYHVSTGATNPKGRPGKLICDFGALGSGTNVLSATGWITSAALTQPQILLPGTYWVSFVTNFSGGTGSPGFNTMNNMVVDGVGGSINGYPVISCYNDTGVSNTAPDPANASTGYVVSNYYKWVFALSP